MNENENPRKSTILNVSRYQKKLLTDPTGTIENIALEKIKKEDKGLLGKEGFGQDKTWSERALWLKKF